MADYIEYIQSYYVPRIRYRSKFNRNTSPQGSDVLGFKLGTTPSPRDEAIIFEVKGTSDPKGKKKGMKGCRRLLIIPIKMWLDMLNL